MTLSLAWVRKVGEAHELVFASDSRLSGGQSWDGCPKIFTLPRGDSMIAFAGDTLSAYPLLLEFRNWVEFDARVRSGPRSHYQRSDQPHPIARPVSRDDAQWADWCGGVRAYG